MPGDKVVVLGTRRALSPPEVNPDAVEKLETMLARAKAGELRAVAIAGLTTEGYTGCYAEDDRQLDRPALLGAIMSLQHRYLTECDL